MKASACMGKQRRYDQQNIDKSTHVWGSFTLNSYEINSHQQSHEKWEKREATSGVCKNMERENLKKIK